MLTPVEFFNGGEVNPNPADTVRGAVGVLDRNGVVRTVSESGVRIFLPEIVDVPGGNIRTRYPVFPIFSEGGTTFKEVCLSPEEQACGLVGWGGVELKAWLMGKALGFRSFWLRLWMFSNDCFKVIAV